jgi:cytochrome c oxidase subunit 3
MDIPYTVAPRQDTGLYNAKVGIWLFLASEVMLFGALFSAYILLRVGADDVAWPHRLLNVPLGTLNTLVLITSSITVVMAWTKLKLNDFSGYKKFQTVTILCALCFLVIKSFEYRDKFMHYEVIKTNGEIVDGHLKEKTKDFVVLEGHVVPKVPMGERAIATGAVIRNEKGGADPAHEHHAEHTEIKIPTAEIKKMENYGPWHNTYMAIYFTLTGLHALHVIGGALVIAFIWGPGAGMWKTEPERYTNRVEVSGLFWHFVDLVWIFLFPVLYLL